jgi:molecular chaperone GrpE
MNENTNAMENNEAEKETTFVEDNNKENPNEHEKLMLEYNELKDKYLRNVAEFDNFRRRTAKERLELIQTAGKEIITALLEVLDDCERAEKQWQVAENDLSAHQGTILVFNKLKHIMQQKGLQSMESIGQDFNSEKHEAIAEIETGEDMKGKVIDEMVKGYYLNEKLIRFAKVVVGK